MIRRLQWAIFFIVIGMLMICTALFIDGLFNSKETIVDTAYVQTSKDLDQDTGMVTLTQIALFTNHPGGGTFEEYNITKNTGKIYPYDNKIKVQKIENRHKYLKRVIGYNYRIVPNR